MNMLIIMLFYGNMNANNHSGPSLLTHTGLISADQRVQSVSDRMS